jgi:hypothetical protein
MPGAPLLVLISGDPRASGRAFEAMRIGVGLVAGEHAVTFVLAGPAVHLLDADTDDLVDGDDVARFRESLRGLGVPFHVVAADVPADPDWNEAAHPVVRILPGRLAELVGEAGRVLAF